MIHVVETGGAWRLAFPLPSIDFAGPSAVSMTPGRIDVFGVGSDYVLQQLYYSGGKSGTHPPPVRARDNGDTGFRSLIS